MGPGAGVDVSKKRKSFRTYWDSNTPTVQPIARHKAHLFHDSNSSINNPYFEAPLRWVIAAIYMYIDGASLSPIFQDCASAL